MSGNRGYQSVFTTSCRGRQSVFTIGLQGHQNVITMGHQGHTKVMKGSHMSEKIALVVTCCQFGLPKTFTSQSCLSCCVHTVRPGHSICMNHQSRKATRCMPGYYQRIPLHFGDVTNGVDGGGIADTEGYYVNLLDLECEEKMADLAAVEHLELGAGETKGGRDLTGKCSCRHNSRRHP